MSKIHNKSKSFIKINMNIVDPSCFTSMAYWKKIFLILETKEKVDQCSKYVFSEDLLVVEAFFISKFFVM